MEELIFKLLEQTPLVIVLFIGLYDFRNKINEKDKEFSAEREIHRQEKAAIRDAHISELKERADKHANDLKEIHNTVNEVNKSLLITLDNLTDAIDDMLK